MTEAADAFSGGFLRLKQKRVRTDDVVFGDADIAISFASFEPRCTEITRARAPTCKEALVFCFAAPETDNDRKTNAATLRQFFAASSARAEVYPLARSIDFLRVREELEKVLLSAVERQGRAVSLLIDISTCPKVYFLFLLAMGFSAGLISGVSIFYSEANYVSLSAPAIGASKALDFKFTDGTWTAAQVPYLEGRFKPGWPRHSVVSVGGEAASVEKFIKRYDPDSVTLICPIPGVDSRLDQNVRKETSLIGRNFVATKVVNRPAFDVAGTIRAVADIAGSRGAENDLSLFCLGSKPQALALGICGLIDPDLQIICRIPTRYVEQKNTGNGWGWVYDLSDTSSPPG